MIKIALAGNPNSGKTTLFNVLTGSTAHVGNWPGVTVEKREGAYKKGVEPMSIVDLPGIYSLSPYTSEEVVSRNYILDEKPDCIVNIVDATNLERNLYLTTQLLELDVPMVIALNMIDLVTKQGDLIDEKELEKRLGLPVVKISALRREGLSTLMQKAYEESKKGRKAQTVLEHSEIAPLLQSLRESFAKKGVKEPLFHAVKLIEADGLEAEMHPEESAVVEDFKKTFQNELFGADFEALIADARYQYITARYSPLLQRKHAGIKTSKSDKADKILTHKWFGIPIFLVILLSVFHLTFAADFLYLGAIFSLPTLEELGFADNFSTSLLACVYDGAVFSPGVILFNLTELLTGSLSGIIVSWLENLGASAWALGLVGDGILAGLCGVLSFVPQIIFLLLLLSIMEDSGYMSRIAFIMDRIFRRFGVSGRAFIPMIMGFGCSIPAMTNTRTLSDERERTLTIRVIPFFTCGAKLPILAAVSGAIVTAFGFGNADLITYSMYVIGLALAVVTVILMRSTTQKGEIAPFIMELPAYHLPSGKGLAVHLWDKAKHYIQKVFTIILASTVVIWFLSNFGWNFKMTTIDESILSSIGKLMQPVFTPLGFGSQLGGLGWVFAVAAIMGLIAKENVLAAFLTVASVIVALVSSGALQFVNPDVLTPEVLANLSALIEGGEFGEDGYEVIAMIAATGISWQGLIAFIVFNMSTVPCFAAVATARGELGKGKFGWTIGFWLLTSYLASTVTYTVLSWWWSAFIWLALAIAIVVCIRKYNQTTETGIK
ncbi:MAG: ferrous iron transporter B [Clostridia bacterium]|nr:ferrous iron transporter B [Clostridia bacterium]